MWWNIINSLYFLSKLLTIQWFRKNNYDRVFKEVLRSVWGHKLSHTSIVLNICKMAQSRVQDAMGDRYFPITFPLQPKLNPFIFCFNYSFGLHRRIPLCFTSFWVKNQNNSFSKLMWMVNHVNRPSISTVKMLLKFMF